jgi:putative membrane protein
MAPGLLATAHAQGDASFGGGGRTTGRVGVEAAREGQAETGPATPPATPPGNQAPGAVGTPAGATQTNVGQAPDNPPAGAQVTPGARPDINATAGVSERTVRPIDDRLFAAAAAASGLAEIATSKLAMQHAASERVREYARQMIQDHNQAYQRLQALASEKRITLPTNLDVQDQAAGEYMAGLTGADFDRDYMRNQVLAHIKAVSLFQTAAQRGQDQQLRAFASETLPRLQHHEQMARQIASQMGLLDFQAGERDAGVNRTSAPAAGATPGAGVSPGARSSGTGGSSIDTGRGAAPGRGNAAGGAGAGSTGAGNRLNGPDSSGAPNNNSGGGGSDNASSRP